MNALLLATLLAGPVASAGGPAWKLTPDGWGPVKIGMTQSQVSNRLKAGLKGEPIEDEQTCVEKVAANDTYPGLIFMFQDGRLTRISVGEPSKVTTPRGIGVGTGAAAVRRAYGGALKAEPNHYEDLPAEYLTFWTVQKKRGVRFETHADRRVYVIHAGDESIELIEGCA
jgi:hypothetical protein